MSYRPCSAAVPSPKRVQPGREVNDGCGSRHDAARHVALTVRQH